MEVKLTGLKGLIALIFIALVFGYKYTTAIKEIDISGRETLQAWVASEYQRYHLSRNDLSEEEKGNILLKTNTVEFSQMSALGNLDNLAVFVEIVPNAAHPPNMPYQRYFRMQYSLITGWRHKADITRFQYYLTLF